MEAMKAFISLDGNRLSQNDVNLPSIRLPARPMCLSSIKFVGMINPTIVLSFEFILGRSRSRITMSPECLDENLPFLLGLELQKYGFFFRGDNIDNFFFQPLLIFSRKLAYPDFFCLERKDKSHGQENEEDVPFH
jgi:hypothetical protein